MQGRCTSTMDCLPVSLRARQASCEESVRRALADVRRKAAAIHQGDGPMADEDALEVSHVDQELGL